MIGNISSIFHYLVIVVGYALNLWPVFVFFLIYTIFKRKPVTQLTIMVVIVVLIALQFEPTEYDDLSRIYDELDMFRRYGFLGFSNVYAASDRFEGRIVWFIFEWLCSYLPNFIYQVITSVLIYSFAGLLVLRIGKNEQFSEIETSRLIIFLFVLINLYSSISSSRYLVVMAILANLFYTEMVEKKHRISCWVGYVILCFCHTIALTLLLFRILAFFRKTILRVIFSILIIGWKQLIDQLEVIVSLLPADNPFFLEVSSKFITYSTMDESSQVFYHIVLIMYLALFLIVWIRNKNDENNYMLNSVLLYTSMMSLGSIGNINMLFRYAHFTMMFLPIFYCSAKYCDDTGEISYIECERGVVTAQDAAIILVCIMVDIYYSFGQWAYLF